MISTITPIQRDALYELLLDRLSGIEDVWLAASSEDYSNATRLGREYSDDLRLILDDLGFGPGSNKPIQVTTSPEVLRRVLPRLHEAAASQCADQRRESLEVCKLEQRNGLIMETCEELLANLSSGRGY